LTAKLNGLIFRGDGDGGPGAVVACSEEDKLRPSPGGVPIRVTFANRSGGEIRVFRQDFSGTRVRVATMLDEETNPAVETNVARPLVVTRCRGALPVDHSARNGHAARCGHADGAGWRLR
jgi:hypothetical protein